MTTNSLQAPVQVSATGPLEVLPVDVQLLFALPGSHFYRLLLLTLTIDLG